MLNKPFKVLIGTDVSRTAACVAGASMVTIVANAVAGEILVFDKNRKVLAAGSTIADTDVIYIGQATGVTFDYTSETNSTVTGARKLIFSDPIEGRLVKTYLGKAYTAVSQQATTFTCTNMTVTAGTELKLRIIYKDLQEVKGGGQFVHSYTVTTVTGDDVDTVADKFYDLINAHSGARVTPTLTAGSDYLILTGKVIPSCTTSLDDTDEFVVVRFDAYLTKKDADGNDVASGATKSTTEAVVGNGTWTLVRDAEKAGRGYKGFTNQTTFPIIKPEWSTVKSETYDTIVIEHSKSYIAPDNLYTKATPLKTVVFIPNTATSNQMDSVLTVLNPWFASCPGSFKPVSF
jgi:hypothetical protein